MLAPTQARQALPMPLCPSLHNPPLMQLCGGGDSEGLDLGPGKTVEVIHRVTGG